MTQLCRRVPGVFRAPAENGEFGRTKLDANRLAHNRIHLLGEHGTCWWRRDHCRESWVDGLREWTAWTGGKKGICLGKGRDREISGRHVPCHSHWLVLGPEVFRQITIGAQPP